MAQLGDVRRDLKRAYQRLKSWRLVGAEFGVSKGMAFRIVVQRYEPKDREIRERLGLNPIRLAPAPVCPVCGVVHVSRRCPKKSTETQRARRRLFDLPVGVLRRMLDEREEF